MITTIPSTGDYLVLVAEDILVMPSENPLLPTAIHGLHALSFLLSVMILLLSIQDCGMLSVSISGAETIICS